MFEQSARLSPLSHLKTLEAYLQKLDAATLIVFAEKIAQSAFWADSQLQQEGLFSYL
jgi:hypothetical protein